ncbi:hypothetical protein [Hoeflea sp.]|uniref:hypothetical protein n=1 Tax=Hoeflea sp. TaxID=1940281 RepID=UPI003B521436
MKTILATAFLAISATSAMAAEGDRAAEFDRVCASAFVKSEKLTKACQSGDMPDVLKDGSRFYARGIGAEVNTLAANLHFLLPACEAEDSVNCRWDATARGNGKGQSFANIDGNRTPTN